MIALARRLARFIRARDGNVAIETAILTPFVLLTMFGAADIVRYLQVKDSVVRAASTTADAIARQNGITQTQVTAFLTHAAGTIDPISAGGLSLVTVASVHKPGVSAAGVAWRRSADGGSTPYEGDCQQVGLEGADATLPVNFPLNDDGTIIVAEACYKFIPSFLISRAIFDLDFIPLDIYGRSISAARFSSLNILQP